MLNDAMLLSAGTLIILTISALFSSVIAGTSGMAGGVLFLGVLASLVETKYVVPLFAVVMAISNSTRIILFFKHINWRIFGYYTLGLLPGALLGIYIFRLLPKDLITLMMGIFILLAISWPSSKTYIRTASARLGTHPVKMTAPPPSY